MSAKPQFVHSGSFSLAHYFNFGTASYQQVEHNIVPGTTYRAGVWVKIWSSDGIDRTRSENPSDLGAQICINAKLEDDETLNYVCSAWVQPFDVWQFISVDAVASADKLTVFLISKFIGPGFVEHNEVLWDDVTLGAAPVSATATPIPETIVASRPAPVPFDAIALRDNMNHVRSQIEQMGGLLDRMVNGEPGKCEEYQNYYKNLILSPIYDGVPPEWQTIYNDYIFAVENAISTNEGLNSLCDSGGGGVTQQNYGSGRQGINSSLDRLIPAIETANALLSS